jgi:molecular chaperone HtpG
LRGRVEGCPYNGSRATRLSRRQSREMTLPPKLDELLKRDSSLYGSVLLSYAEFDPLFRLNKTPFFPEFTDHSAKHILEVLQAASSLVRDEAWPVLTSGDAALLCLATLLHDCAMHLTEDGFLSLVADPSRPAPLPGEVAWPVMWAEFLSEASRFDGRRLTELFGSNEPIRRPDPDPINWTQKDHLLIGEFVRRHHPRLAHEIALVGFPGPTGSRLELKQVPMDLAVKSQEVVHSA